MLPSCTVCVPFPSSILPGHSKNLTGHIIHMSAPSCIFLLITLRHPWHVAEPRNTLDVQISPLYDTSVWHLAAWSWCALSGCSLAQMTSVDECDMSKVEDGGVVTLQLQHSIPLNTPYSLSGPVASWVTVFKQCFLTIFTQGYHNLYFSFYSSASNSPLFSFFS